MFYKGTLINIKVRYILNQVVVGVEFIDINVLFHPFSSLHILLVRVVIGIFGRVVCRVAHRLRSYKGFADDIVFGDVIRNIGEFVDGLISVVLCITVFAVVRSLLSLQQ